MPVRITPDRVRADVLRHRAEHHIDAGPMTIHVRAVAQPAAIARAVALDQQMPIAGRDVDVAGKNVLAILRLAHRHRRAAIHALGKRLAESRGNVLRDHDRRRIRRQRREHFANGFGAAGRRADGDDAIGGAQHTPPLTAGSTASALRR